MFKIKDISFALAVLIMSFLVGYFVFAWVDPPIDVTPPEGNVPGPINVGDINQVKSGGLSVGSFISRFGTILGLESGNIGIGTTTTEAKLHVEGHAIAFDPIEDSHLVTKRYLEQYVADHLTP